MIGIYDEKVKDIPCLVVVDVKNKYEALPMLTYFHGFTSAKEHNLPLAYLMAEKGFRVILPDSAYHGARADTKSNIEMQLLFWDIVIQNVHELQDIYHKYQAENLLLNDAFGVSGTSMGGITTGAALAKYSWIKAAAILMGSPKLTQYAEELVAAVSHQKDFPLTEKEVSNVFKQLKSYDLSKNMTALCERPLLFWHGKEDDIVPYVHAYDFYQEAREMYDNTENIQFISEENQSHKVSRHAILNTVDWFSKHLS